MDEVKGDVFLITAYCETEYKKDILKQCVLELKKIGVNICISSHYPIDSEIQQLVNYCIYDYSNPVIYDGSKSITRWRWYVTANLMLNLVTPDYSYTVINLWKNGLNFLKNLGYERVHVVNYDNFINDISFFKKRSNILKDYDIEFLYSNSTNIQYSQISDILITFFSIKNSIIDDFLEELSFNKYINYRNAMLEQYLSLSVIPELEKKYKIHSLMSGDYKEFMSGGSVSVTLDNFDIYDRYTDDNKYWYSYFCGQSVDTGFLHILIYEISEPIDKIEIEIENLEYHSSNNIPEKYYLIKTSIKNEDFSNYENRIKIKINGKSIINNNDIKNFIKLNSIVYIK